MLDADTHIVNAVEEEAILELQGLILALDVVDDTEHLLV